MVVVAAAVGDDVEVVIFWFVGHAWVGRLDKWWVLEVVVYLVISGCWRWWYLVISGGWR